MVQGCLKWVSFCFPPSMEVGEGGMRERSKNPRGRGNNVGQRRKFNGVPPYKYRLGYSYVIFVVQAGRTESTFSILDAGTFLNGANILMIRKEARGRAPPPAGVPASVMRRRGKKKAKTLLKHSTSVTPSLRGR